jgi:hypothetical protein
VERYRLSQRIGIELRHAWGGMEFNVDAPGQKLIWPNGVQGVVQARWTGNDDGKRYVIDPDTDDIVAVEDDSEGGVTD